VGANCGQSNDGQKVSMRVKLGTTPQICRAPSQSSQGLGPTGLLMVKLSLDQRHQWGANGTSSPHCAHGPVSLRLCVEPFASADQCVNRSFVSHLPDGARDLKQSL
jgi:hypothetical protein